MPRTSPIRARAAVAAFSIVALLVTAPDSRPQGSSVADAWSPIIAWRTHTGQTTAAVHATLMMDGRVLLFGIDTPFGFLMTPPAIGAAPSQITMEGFRMPAEFPAPGVPYGGWSNVEDTLYCAGHATLADGSVFVAGGTRTLSTTTSGTLRKHYVGLSYASILGPSPALWRRVPEKMVGAGQLGVAERWYPTVTRLADGRMLVTSGADYIVPPSATSTNRSVEIYTPGAGGPSAWTLLSTHEQSPREIYNIDYSHVFQLPDRLGGRFDLMIFGEHGQPVFLSLDGPPAERWMLRDRVRPGQLAAGRVPTLTGHHADATIQALPARGPNHFASSVLLPLRAADPSEQPSYHPGTVLMVGGESGSTYEHTIDVYDPVADAWIGPIETGVVRHHPSTVILPDGRILILAGHSDLPQGDPGVGRAQYVDPRNGFSLSEGTAHMPEVRGYHTVTLLLPDGRVLVGGGNPDNAAFQERDDFRLYSPDYMAKPRPVITSSPPVIALGSRFGLQWQGQSHVQEAVLIALGSMTHSFDSTQRAVELEIARHLPNGVLDIRAPARPEVAPPGYYMLFVVDENRVPSVARIVRLR